MDKKQTPSDVFDADRDIDTDDGRTDIDRELERVESIESMALDVADIEQNDGSVDDLGEIEISDIEQKTEPIASSKNSNTGKSANQSIDEDPEMPTLSDEEYDPVVDPIEVEPEINNKKEEDSNKTQPEHASTVKSRPEPQKTTKAVVQKRPKSVNTDALLNKMRKDITKTDEKKKSPVGMVFAVILILALLGVVAYLYYQNTELDSQLNSANQRLNSTQSTATSSSTEQATTNSSNSVAATTGSDKYDITEWGLTYDVKKNDDINYKFIIDPNGQEQLGFYSTKLVRTTTNRHIAGAVWGAHLCGEDAYFASIMRVKASDIEDEGKINEAKLKEYYRNAVTFDSPVYKKVGDYYYLAIDVYTNDGEVASCLPDNAEYKKEQDEAKVVAEYAKKIVQSLKAKEANVGEASSEN